VPAAVLMAMTHAVFHAYPGPRIAPGEVLSYLNRHMTRFHWPRFVTALYAIFDSRDRTLRVSSAGHMPPVLFRESSGGAMQMSYDPVFPLGVAAFEQVPTATHTLRPGDRLLFYTDGVTERFSPSDEMYGVERLLQRFGASDAADPEQAVSALMTDVDGFASGRPAEDDQTLLVAFVE
jgi:sigma-B regulation protein RsbU (phosphoserine phosphatase)